MQLNNNKILRRTLSKPPIFNFFSDFYRYMNSQSQENSKNNSISVKLPLRRSISDPSTADIILPPAPTTATPALTSKTTKRKRVEDALEEDRFTGDLGIVGWFHRSRSGGSGGDLPLKTASAVD
ncbi:hypothetical protein RND71_012833 [Anisodus tanguticus]|uniref:Uncharacterized protein n=1 Tax=Anisodus tanguticus TaxID=243964 RepID=A0AAE1VM62_9SOLA|nr:hypothetical protein RND71_012833 [Anisodus tanguticus]